MKKGKSRLLRLASFSMALLLSASMSGCGFEMRKTQQGKPVGAKMVVIGQSKGIQFWDFVEQGAKDAGTELEYSVEYCAANDTSDIDGQKKLIKEAIDKNAKAIIVAPNSATELNGVIRDALDKGIVVMTINSDVDNQSLRTTYVGTMNASAGAIAARQALTYMSDPDHYYEELPGKFGIVTHSVELSSAQERVNTFISALGGPLQGVYGPLMGQKMAKLAAQRAQQGGGEGQQGAPDGEGQQGAPGGEGQQGAPGGQGQQGAAGGQGQQLSPEFFIAAQECCEGDADIAKELATKMINEHPEMKVIYATNERSTVGVCEAVVDARKEGKATDLMVIGYNANKDEQDYIQNDILTGTMLQNPYNIGYLSILYAGNQLTDQSAPGMVDTGVVYVNKQNLQHDDIQLLLDPKAFIAKK